VRIGVYGGSFDPPHVGHLLMASDAFELLALDRLLFVPAATQPLKVGAAAASPSDRFTMVRLLCGGDPRFEVDPVEIDRSGLSYTVDTLAALATRHAGAELFFLVGADVLATFADWREPDRVLELARLVVLRRAGTTPDVTVDALAARLAPPASRGGREPIVLAVRRVDVSSTEVRARVRAGQPIGGFVPEAVAGYVRARGLYQ
jgi:nicotinate-nucleotide adenylyltransferase